MTALWIILIIFFSFMFGFALAGILAGSKNGDLWEENCKLRTENNKLKEMMEV